MPSKDHRLQRAVAVALGVAFKPGHGTTFAFAKSLRLPPRKSSPRGTFGLSGEADCSHALHYGGFILRVGEEFAGKGQHVIRLLVEHWQLCEQR